MNKSLTSTNIEQHLDAEFVQPLAAQIEVKQLVSKSKSIQSKNGAAAFVQPMAAQMPKILELTTFTNHIEILCRCKRYEQRLFYILYAHKEKLGKREMSRSMSSTMVAEYKRILIPQEKMQQQLREFCQFFSKEDKS